MLFNKSLKDKSSYIIIRDMSDLSGDIFNDDIIRYILKLRREIMRDDKIKNDKIKLLTEFNMINNMIINYDDKCDDNEKTDYYNYKDYENDVLNFLINDDYNIIYEGLNDYYINKITYNDFKNILNECIYDGLYFYKTCSIIDTDNIISEFYKMINIYDDDLLTFFKNNEKNLHQILKKILYNKKSEDDPVRQILNKKDYDELCEM